ncbi:hypothetical protein MAH1_05280 [Sessilibacter sp. MAH1]
MSDNWSYELAVSSLQAIRFINSNASKMISFKTKYKDLLFKSLLFEKTNLNLDYSRVFLKDLKAY